MTLEGVLKNDNFLICDNICVTQIPQDLQPLPHSCLYTHVGGFPIICHL